MHIHLTGNKYLNSDEYQYWITQETTRKKEDGTVIPVRKLLTGYHGTNKGDRVAIENLLNDYFERNIRSTNLDGELDDLISQIKKTRREIHKWVEIIAEQIGDSK